MSYSILKSYAQCYLIINYYIGFDYYDCLIIRCYYDFGGLPR